MANIKIIWGVSLVPVAVALILLPSKPIFAAVVYLAIALGIWEYCAMTLPGAGLTSKLVNVIVGLAVALTFYLEVPAYIAGALVGGSAFYMIYYLLAEKDVHLAFAKAKSSIFGLIYVPVLASFLVLLKSAQYTTGINWILPLFLLVWINDSGAYFAGRALGKRKPFPNISPNKTLAGFVGGLLTSIAAAAVWGYFVELHLIEALLLGLALGVIGPIGDLVESMIKRASNAKDSGNIIPGHGGVLDRVDSVIFAAPFLYFYVWFRFLQI